MVDRSAKRFITQSRGHIFDGVIFCIEMGPYFLICGNCVIGWILWNLFGNSTYSLLLFLPLPLITFFILFIGYVVLGAYFIDPLNLGDEGPDWENEKVNGIVFKTDNAKELRNQYRKKKIPMEKFVEAYLNEHIDINCDMIELFRNRYDYFSFVITWGHVEWFFGTFLGQLTGHSITADRREVGDVYNRGNDFYAWFLGPSMVYTSGVFRTLDYHGDSLERAQLNKMNLICQTLQMKKGQTHLDIGCGWGTLVIHAAKHFGTISTGCTLAKEQVIFAKNRIKNEEKSTLKVNFIVEDYRKIPILNNGRKYDCISCVEMAEHVGIKNFRPFLEQVNSMLKDDGLFYIQMCGLRYTWSWEDIIWILFMGKYIFPGADASTPINWVINQLERSGFEVHRMESLGCHYGRTIQKWHGNWTKNKSLIVKKYKQRWFRLWDVFLAWSTMIGRQHTSNVYMITCNKNTFCDELSVDNKLNKNQVMPILNRTKKFIGPKLISYQQ